MRETSAIKPITSPLDNDEIISAAPERQVTHVALVDPANSAGSVGFAASSEAADSIDLAGLVDAATLEEGVVQAEAAASEAMDAIAARTASAAKAQHIPVLLHEAVAALSVEKGKIFLDATFGRGGHSSAILDKLSADGQLFALDRDLEAVEYGRKHLHDSRFQLFHSRFSRLAEIAESAGIHGKIDGILFDLGVSSPQLDQAERGFSFRQAGPLDMRMDCTQQLTAASWLSNVSERRLAEVLGSYGEERYCKRIATAIIEARLRRPIVNTAQLAEIVKAAHPRWEVGKHPATKTFQAIRIAVNNELEELEAGLEAAWRALRVGGTMVVISFHSLEDRLVKKVLRKYSGGLLPSGLPIKHEALGVKLRSAGKAVRATVREVADNVRARSAVMRVIERVG